MEDLRLLINGKLVPGDSTMPVINPATEESIGDCPRASRQQLDQAVAAAKAAFPGWSATPIGERRKLLVQIADRIDAHQAELARLLTQEQGKPLADATGEVAGMSAFFRYFASLDLPGRFDVSPPSAPRAEPWGLTVCYLTDPAGVLWHFAQPTETG